MRGAQKKTTSRARMLQQVDNDCEAYFWSLVRNRRLNGHKFVRQFSIGPYFADFTCRQERLVIKLDGSQHIGSAYDKRRNDFMAQNGWSVLRFWNSDIFIGQAAVEEPMVAVLDKRLTEGIDCVEFQYIPAIMRL